MLFGEDCCIGLLLRCIHMLFIRPSSQVYSHVVHKAFFSGVFTCCLVKTAALVFFSGVFTCCLVKTAALVFFSGVFTCCS